MKRFPIIPLVAGVGAGLLAFHLSAADTTMVAGPNLNQGRMAHSVVRLPDGRVVLFGGHGPGFETLASADVYAPAENRWTALAMQYPHDSHAFVQLADGRLLLAGGASSLGIPAYDHVELFDPATGMFTPAGKTVRFRASSGGAQLTGGKVLLAGAWWGHNDAYSYGEIYDPVTATSAATGPLTLGRSGPLVFPTPDGNAVVVGGFHYYGGNILPTPELYSAANNTFAKLSDELFASDPGWMVGPYFGAVQVVQDYRLNDGRYLCSMYRPKTGATEQGLFTFDPATKVFARFETTPALPDTTQEIYAYPPQFDLAAGKAYLLGFIPNASPQRAFLRSVDLGSGATVRLPGDVVFPADYETSAASFTRLPDGRFLLAGGATPGTGNFGARVNTFLLTPGSTGPSVALALHAAVTVTGDVGAAYVVEYATALAPDEWLPLTTVTLTGPSERVYDPTPIESAGKRFYRARPAP